MKNNNKIIFIVTLICVILAVGIAQIEVIKQINYATNTMNSNSEKINDYTNSEYDDDTKGFAIIGYGIENVANGIAIVFYITIDFIFVIATITYLMLNMIAWISVLKEENSKKQTLCMILYIIALVIQAIILFFIIKFSKIILLIGGNAILYVLFIFVQIIPIVVTAGLYFGNYSKYKEQYKKIEE